MKELDAEYLPENTEEYHKATAEIAFSPRSRSSSTNSAPTLGSLKPSSHIEPVSRSQLQHAWNLAAIHPTLPTPARITNAIGGRIRFVAEP